MSNYSIEAEIKANISKYRKAIQSAKRVTQSFKREADRAKNTELDGDTKPLNRSLKKAKMLMHKFTKSKNEVNVDADTSEAVRKLGMLQAVKKAINKKVVIPIEARVNKFHRMVGRIANNIRALETVSMSVFSGIGIIASSVAIPALASLVPVIAAIGNSLAVVGSAAVALGAAFGIAGGAVLAFGAAALPTITSIVDGTAKATEENKKAAKALETLKSSWQKVQKAIAPQVAIAFGNALRGINTAITSLKPMFESVASAVASLSAEFNEFAGSKTAQAFFGYLNKNAAPILNKIASGIGGFIKGLMNLTVAFAPLTDFVVQGFANMGQSFANFTGKIQGSAALRNFINFVKTNLPLIGSIFGNVFLGVINLFSAFSGSTTTILQSLATMAESFRTWSATIKESDGFQKFMLYVQENGPKVLALIGQVITFVMNMAIALAPLGATVLDLATKFFAWMNGLIQTNPWIGKLIAMGGLLVSALLKLAPVITIVIGAFFRFMGSISKVLPWVTRIGGALLRFATGPIGLVIQAVILVATIVIKNWDSIKTFTINTFNAVSNFLKIAWAVIKTIFRITVSAIKIIIKGAWNNVKSVTLTVFKAIKIFIKAVWIAIKIIFKVTVAVIKTVVKAAWDKIKSVTSTVFNGVKSFIKSVWNGIKNIFKVVVNAIKSVVQGAWNRIKSVTSSVFNGVKSVTSNVWNGIKSTISSVVTNIKSVISNIFNSLKGVVSKAFKGVKSAVKTGINKALDVVVNIKDKFLEAGKNIVGSIAKGITGAIGKVKDAIGNVTQKIRDFLPFSPAKEGALRDIMKIKISQSIAKAIDRGSGVAVKSMANLTSSINKEMPNPEIQFKTSKITSSLRSLNRKSSAQVKNAINADVSVSKQPANINIRIGRTEFRAFVEDITDQQLRGAFSDSKIKF